MGVGHLFLIYAEMMLKGGENACGDWVEVANLNKY